MVVNHVEKALALSLVIQYVGVDTSYVYRRDSASAQNNRVALRSVGILRSYL